MSGDLFEDHLSALKLLYESLQSENSFLQFELKRSAEGLGSKIYEGRHLAHRFGPGKERSGAAAQPLARTDFRQEECGYELEAWTPGSAADGGTPDIFSEAPEATQVPTAAASSTWRGTDEASDVGQPAEADDYDVPADEHPPLNEAASPQWRGSPRTSQRMAGERVVPPPSPTDSSTDGPPVGSTSTILLPTGVVGKQIKRCSTRDAIMDGLIHSAASHTPGDFGVLSPVSNVRLVWDLTAGTLLLYEMWVTPIILVFFGASDTPAAIRDFGAAITIFFFADILLNFNTGFVEHSDRLVMQRFRIIKDYLKFWFWLDLVATIPFDRIAMLSRSEGETMAPYLRFGRAFRMLKNLRYLKILRTLRLMRRHSSGGVPQKLRLWVHGRVPLGYVTGALQMLVPMCVVSHFLGSAWAFIRLEDSELQDAPLRRYFESFWWAFVNIAGGVLGAPSWATRPDLWAMDLVIVTVRLVLLVLGGQLCIVRALTRDHAMNSTRERALEYLRCRKVGFAVQLQVLQCFTESGQVRKLQSAFNDLMSNEIPPTIRGMVSEELWCSRLLSFQLFGLLQQWSNSIIIELSLSVREEALASQVIVFHEGDQSPTALNIIKGKVKHTYFRGLEDLEAPYTDGMWLGEMALFNPLLLRSTSCVTQTLTTLMVVSVAEFHQSVEKHGLRERFHAYCKRNLWKGVCARCGSIGDHWPNDCAGRQVAEPSDASPRGEMSVSRSLSRSLSRGQFGGDLSWAKDPVHSKDPMPAGEMTGGASDLSKFLEYEGMSFLSPHLAAMGVSRFDDLEQADLAMVNASLLERIGPDVRTIFLEHAFTAEGLARFRNVAEASVNELMHFGTCIGQHLVFLSHYKREAGTEAALIRNEIKMLLLEDSGHPGNLFDVPIFLDSENLRNLDQLRKHVQQSHNLLVILTEGVLTRPWCLVEIVTAVDSGVDLVPVCVGKPGQSFKFPDDDFYKRLSEGSVLDDGAAEVLNSCGMKLTDVSRCVREVFKRIALPYEPHASTPIRLAQVRAILGNCKLREGATV